MHVMYHLQHGMVRGMECLPPLKPLPTIHHPSSRPLTTLVCLSLIMNTTHVNKYGQYVKNEVFITLTLSDQNGYESL